MFDAPTKRYPEKWSEMSLDYKLAFIYHCCVLVLFATGGVLTIQGEIVVAGSLVLVLVAISVRHRRVSNWRWPSVSFGNVLAALGAAMAIAFFLFSASPGFPPSNPRYLPWYLGGLGIGVFGILAALRVVEMSQAEFVQHCRIIDQYGREVERIPPPPIPTANEPAWKKTVRGIYTVAFMIIWVAGGATFWLDGSAFGHGASQPTADQTEPMTEHGKTVFVTRTEKNRMDDLHLVSWVGIPVVFIGAAVLHFLVGVKLFPGVPSLAEYRSGKANR